MNCKTCQRTCCEPCNTGWMGRYACAAMTWGGDCVTCQCRFGDHKRESVRYVQTKVTEEDTIDEVLQRHRRGRNPGAKTK